MSFTLLHRINPAENERRFYFVCTGPSLFHPIAVIRSWGRIGGYTRSMITACASGEEAEKLATRLVKKRLKRGYTIVEGETPGN